MRILAGKTSATLVVVMVIASHVMAQDTSESTPKQPVTSGPKSVTLSPSEAESA